MDWDRLRIFLLVANEGSLTDASKRLNLSQSSISRQIKVGGQLKGRFVPPTPKRFTTY